MSNYVTIANSAAMTVGTSARLLDPGDDTVLGRAVASVWDIERKAALRDGAWNFAMKRAELAALVQTPVHEYPYKFQVPADCLRLIELYNLPRAAWQLESKQILSKELGPLRIRYLADIKEPALFDPQFAHCFALRIACAIGNRIAGSTFKEELNWNKYRQALAEAKRTDAMENPPIDFYESEWVQARWAGDRTDLTRLDGFGWRG
jgi:hypothetical protein